MGTIKLGMEKNMEKQRILEMAQNGKRGDGEYEHHEFLKSSSFSSIVALIVCLILLLVEYFAKGSFNFSVAVVGVSASCVQFFRDGVKTKKWYLVALGCFEMIMGIICLFMFIAWVVL